ncbi:serine/threonine-protein kinase SMG1-like [Impatiens glandulifera]|uniref:serine/threonine-protein kinase SMG1-like n=1 Tax=Impatiens glandulifera TaxID=253017 RepID=UPI001FB1001D|nr:serine/threonine-protein kinase SMG1-like [Impatiens glandulifera]XP_047338056.1 serine/threonine-protein kinase SMG1-like [Impatiens glandulifera]
MMQGLHHQQQQLAALISAALPKVVDSSSSAASSAVPSSEEDETSRYSAINSLHRAIIYPPHSLLISHSASFLAQNLFKVLSDKSYSVRQVAATAYGALCSVLCSILSSSNGRQNQVLFGSIVDRFFSWGMQLLTNVSNGDEAAELALESLREFLNGRDVTAVERYAVPVLKACQELLEDERTSWSLLHRLLNVLTLIALKFPRCFQPHFVDIVDLLLGWAMVPDLGESDRQVIMDSFLQFQNHWVNNLQFSMGLLSKFLGDMDVLLQDGSLGTSPQFQRLIVLLYCFCTVLRATASGLLEISLLDQIMEPLSKMVPSLLRCLSLVGRRFGWSRWITESWKSLTLLAEILGQDFSSFYLLAVDVLFQSLEIDDSIHLKDARKMTSSQIHGVLKTNLQLLSLQKLGLLPTSVYKILHFSAPISQLRLHPSHVVTAASAATYIFLLQHRNNEVVKQAMTSLIEEMELLKNILGQISCSVNNDNDVLIPNPYSRPELLALIKFDLKVILSCVSMEGADVFIGQEEFDDLLCERLERLLSFFLQKLNPFRSPIQDFVGFQVDVIKTLNQLAMIEFSTKCSARNQASWKGCAGAVSEKLQMDEYTNNILHKLTFEHFRKYSPLLVKSLHSSSPLAVKVEALKWICKFCEILTRKEENLRPSDHSYLAFQYGGFAGVLIFSVLGAASDREHKVRALVASVIELLLQAKLIHPSYINAVTEVILEKLGDPDDDIKNAFMRLLAHSLTVKMYVSGIHDCGLLTTHSPSVLKLSCTLDLNWKQIFALRQLPQQLHSQQLVSILSYISQRWKVPLSSWIQRIIQTCQSSKLSSQLHLEEEGHANSNSVGFEARVEESLLEHKSSVNLLAGAWWAIHEAARYCISTRLRTNLGGPTQTFAALERMLLDVAHVLQLDTNQNDGTLNILGSSYARLLPMRLLLNFVEALKKNVFNAYDGSSVLPCPSKQSSLFFRANRKVCEEWFSRICEPMMNAGLALQCHHATICYSALRLQDLSNLVVSAKDNHRAQVSENPHNFRGRFLKDILRVVQHMALALCKSHDTEALTGLEKWVTTTFSSLTIDENHASYNEEFSGYFSWITGLVYQASGQYEKAAAYFSHLLQTEDSLNAMGSEGVHFVIARIIESYAAVSDWKSLDSWLLELQTLRAKHAGKSYSGALTTAGNEINAIHAWARFDENDYQAAWAFLDLTPKSSNELALDPKLALQRSEQMLLQALLLQTEGSGDKVFHDLQKAKLMLQETLSILPLDGLAEAAEYATQLHCISAIEESCKVEGSLERQPQSLLSSYIQVEQSQIGRFHQDLSLWLKIFRVYQNIYSTSPVTLKLCVNLLSIARKQKNLALANRLNIYLRDNATNFPEERCRNSLISNWQYEHALLMHAENNIREAFSSLWSFLCPFITNSSSIATNSDNNVLKAKGCLKLSSWLKRDHIVTDLEDIVTEMLVDFNITNVASIYRENPRLGDDSLNSKGRLDLIVDELVGTATKWSTRLCPTMGKSWVTYASWCYNQARNALFGSQDRALHSCSFSPILTPDFVAERFKLTEEEISRVRSIIWQLLQQHNDINCLGEDKMEYNLHAEFPKHLSNENYVNDLVRQVKDTIEAVARAPGAENMNGESLSTMLNSKFRQYILNALTGLEESAIQVSVDELVNIWWSLRRRNVHLFGVAAQAFINYLSYSSLDSISDCWVASDCDSLDGKSISYTLRATLYILHILLNFGVELKEMLEPALSEVPLPPWQDLTPQLFARLSSHLEPVVRKQLEGLLIRLARLSPWSIVYPTLVDMNAYEEKPSEELQHVLACLHKLYPRLVQDVQLMIKELENVTVLWEELWLSTLQDLHGDVTRRISLLKEEATRIAESTTLSYSEKNKINAAKYSAMMAPIVVALERRLASTSRKPETPHEIWFHNEYWQLLESAISNFKTPPASAATLGDVWRPFENIAACLVSYQRKSSISVGEVAPQLSELSSCDVPMPGLEKQISIFESVDSAIPKTHGIVTISSFSQEITILPTKTKPKKLVMLGSDGNKYTYLLKGREDLRLDARIMQLLQAINGLLHSGHATRDQSLSIRYYSVTPISGRAGLIQWVENVVSIYSIFKSWQNRVQLAQMQMLGSDCTKSSVPPPVPRPSDMFYGKIIPALKEKGIRKVISRRDWPHDVKRKVLLDLMKEAPRELLHQELWCASEGFKAFSSKSKRYSRTVATMSMVGHILGLGDRHLDNILIDFSSGDIVHIDYNVCFDKGHRLKIPEIVPFRLTQAIEAALGLTGTEGTFRASCEAVLGVLRKNKDIILMLLEVFVWDPLVEWTRGDFHDDAAIVGEERKGMELAVSLSLFASRVQEIRVPLQEHHDLFLGTMPTVESALERFEGILSQYELVYALFHHADLDMSNVVLTETSARSIVAEATTTSEKTCAKFEIQAREFSQAKAIVAERGHNATSWVEQHGRILDALRSNSAPEITAQVNLATSDEVISLTSAVLAAGVPLTIVPEPTQAQCNDIDTEVLQLITDMDNGLSSTIKSLQAYSLALQRILPLNYITTTPMHAWAQMLQLSVNNISSDILSLTRRQAADLIAKGDGDGFDSRKHTYDDLCLLVEKYAEEIEKVESEHAELVNSIGSESESKAKDRLISAFKKYMQSMGVPRKEDAASTYLGAVKLDAARDTGFQGEVEDKKEKVFSVFYIAVNLIYEEVKHRVADILASSSVISNRDNILKTDFGTIICEFEEQIEKCILLEGFVSDLQQYMDGNTSSVETNEHANLSIQKSWASTFRYALLSCKNLAGQMIDVALPQVLKSIVSFSSEIMDAFGSLSQVKGSIDTALEQLLEVELERASLVKLEMNYFVNVGLISEKKLTLEEAAMQGRDHLSWEEAEELASQEEACREQLDKLHQAWTQKDLQTSSLVNRETAIKSALISSEKFLNYLLAAEQEREQQLVNHKSSLSALVQPFSELESIDNTLFSGLESFISSTLEISYASELMNSGSPVSEHIWKFPSLPNKSAFFVWKVGIIDSFLDACIQEAASFIDQNLGFDQLLNIVKTKLQFQFQERIHKYIKERLGPFLLARLDKENEILRHMTDTTRESALDLAKNDSGHVKRVQLMLKEYCNAHEAIRAARSAASLLNKKAYDLKESLRKTSVEIVQMDWMHDVSPNPLHSVRLICHKYLASDDHLLPAILNLSRPKLLENMQSSVSKIARSMERLQAVEQNSVTAEGQLERAMGWACGGPNSNMIGNALARNLGIPTEFHNHLTRRQKFLQEAREKASAIVGVSISILEFEASRDGIFRTLGDPYIAGSDGKIWQQTYLNSLTRLDAAYHSFKCAEQEWRLAQSKMEVASNSLFSASNELRVTSLKAKSASGDLQSTLFAMRDCAYEVSVALSAFGRLTRNHSALTSECGSMLDEVLAITEGLHDVYSLGKDAAAVHNSLMKDLSKANAILLPLESILSKDVDAMTDAMAKERETKMEISPIHGQAIYQSYNLRIKEASRALKSLLPSLTTSIKGLLSMMIRLARTASLHAGNLHKALEGLGESQEGRSQDINLRLDITSHESDDGKKNQEILTKFDQENGNISVGISRVSLHDKEWLSPPDSIGSSSSSDSGADPTVASFGNSFTDFREIEQHEDGPSATQFDEPDDQLESSKTDSGENLKLGTNITSALGHTSISQSPSQENVQITVSPEDKASSVIHQKIPHRSQDTLPTDTGFRTRGKNAYAVSVLKQVEMKLDGRGIADNRETSIAEQVDYLVKQATSIDNLCNMYEGWTPWI